jgi:hypothetical protein
MNTRQLLHGIQALALGITAGFVPVDAFGNEAQIMQVAGMVGIFLTGWMGASTSGTSRFPSPSSLAHLTRNRARPLDH